MKRKIYKLVILSILSITLFSCSEDHPLEMPQNESLNDQQKLMQETSVLIGKVLIDKEVKNELHRILKEVDEDSKIVSFAYLFGYENDLRKNEVPIYSKNSKNLRANNIFKSALKNELESNPLEYREIERRSGKISLTESLSKSSSSIADNLASLLVLEELQIFYPYDPEYEGDDMSVSEFYTSFDPLDYAKTNVGYRFKVGDDNFSEVKSLDNNFIDNHPVYLIVPIDPCDIPGRPCGFTELLPSIVDPISGDLNPEGSYPWDDNSDPILYPTTTLLTTNVNHKYIPESHIIGSSIPKIKINGTSWMGFGGTHQKLRFYRALADGTVTQNADGSITASPNKYTIKDFRCKRKYINKEKNRKWMNLNGEFDSDWNMSENTQSMAVFSIHHLSSSAEIGLNTKAGFKMEKDSTGKYRLVPHFEASGTLAIKVKTGSAKFRANTELSRRQVLATIIGNGSTGYTVKDNGIEYNRKSIGIVDYYFKHYHTPL